MFQNKEPQKEQVFRIDELTETWTPVDEETEEPAKAVAPRRFTRRFWRRVGYELVAVLCTAVLVTFLVFMFFRPVTVDGSSMFPTLNTGDRLLLYCFNYIPERGDVVVVQRKDREPLVKRVIAVAGDTIFIDPILEEVYLNGKRLHEPYIHGYTAPLDMEGEITVPEGHLVVMGDNRANSHDSRSADIGMVAVESVVGTAWIRYYPTFTVFQKAEG